MSFQLARVFRSQGLCSATKFVYSALDTCAINLKHLQQVYNYTSKLLSKFHCNPTCFGDVSSLLLNRHNTKLSFVQLQSTDQNVLGFGAFDFKLDTQHAYTVNILLCKFQCTPTSTQCYTVVLLTAALVRVEATVADTEQSITTHT